MERYHVAEVRKPDVRIGFRHCVATVSGELLEFVVRDAPTAKAVEGVPVTVKGQIAALALLVGYLDFRKRRVKVAKDRLLFERLSVRSRENERARILEGGGFNHAPQVGRDSRRYRYFSRIVSFRVSKPVFTRPRMDNRDISGVHVLNLKSLYLAHAQAG